VYKAFEADNDSDGIQEVGEFAVTLWYDSSTSSNPTLAKVSFSIKSTGTSLEDWNEATLMTAHAFWDDLISFSMLDPSSSMKTAWVYNYDSTWFT
jgi:hypothetical protein